MGQLKEEIHEILTHSTNLRTQASYLILDRFLFDFSSLETKKDKILSFTDLKKKYFSQSVYLSSSELWKKFEEIRMSLRKIKKKLLITVKNLETIAETFEKNIFE